MSNGTLEVTVVRAKGLRNSAFFGTLDAYAVVEYKNQEQKSGIGGPGSYSLERFFCFCFHGQGSNPEWNETFKFKVQASSPNKTEDDDLHKLIIKLMDHDHLSGDDYLGQATIYLDEVIQEGMERGRAELQPQKYRVVFSDLSYRGEITVGATFTAGTSSSS